VVDVAPLNEPCPERLQVTPLGSFVVTVMFAVWPALMAWLLEVALTVTGGVVVCVVVVGDPPQALSERPSNSIADNRDIEEFSARLFRIPTSGGRGSTVVKGTLMLSP